ncbi:MAG: AMP-binding protein [Pseudonocardiaceae bacterium]|nr:AMP-binding protein [Pseudonocardiaceae bacterium]
MSSYAAKPWLALYDDAMLATSQATPASTLQAFRRAVERAPEVTALGYFDARLSYRDVDDLSNGVANHLRSRGFGRGDRLAIMLQNIPQFVLALLGAWKLGAVAVPVNPMYRERELSHVLADASVSAIVCSETAWHDFVGAAVTASSVGIRLTTSELEFQHRNDPRVLKQVERQLPKDADDLLDAARLAGVAAPADPRLEPDDLALISYTSGTSGEPKGAINTHGNIAINAATLGNFSGLPHGCVIFGLAPLFHITGMVCQIASAIDIEGTLALAYRFDPGVVLDALMEYRPAYMVGPSTAYMALMAQPDVSPEHFSSFQLLYSGGAPLPPAVVDTFRERFGHYIRNGYGLTETTAGCIVVPASMQAPIDPESGTISIGIPVPDTTVWILDDNGNEVPFGEPGEIVVDGPMVVPGYWNKPAETEAALPGNRMHTGDIGFMDAEGWVYVVDRKKDMINASGFKVWPREVEDVLYTHPAVREAAVVGVPDSYRGETVKAYVSLRPGEPAAAKELITYCRQRLAAYKYPREVELLDELPKTVTGKILRRELRSRAEQP